MKVKLDKLSPFTKRPKIVIHSFSNSAKLKIDLINAFDLNKIKLIDNFFINLQRTIIAMFIVVEVRRVLS